MLIISCSAHAQMDASSAVLLRPNTAAPALEDLEGSRYRVRAPVSKKPATATPDEELDEKPGAMIPSPVVKSAPKAKKEEPPPAPAPVPAPTPVVAAPNEPPAPPPVAEQVRELFLGTPEDIDEYRQQLHPQDPRANVLSLTFAPAYFYEASDSAYSFRRYVTSGPGFGASMDLWFTPFFGLQSKYFSSVTAGVRSGPANTVPIDVQVFEVGLRFRKHFGSSRKAASLSWGVDYHDAGDKISRDSETTIGRRSTGLNLALEAEIPLTVGYAHLIEVGLQPRLHSSELSTTSEARSGTKNETNALTLGLGGQWTLDRRNQIFWKGRYSVERSLFQGDASTVDPHNDQTPSGVSVTNSLLMLQFGFRWGS